MAALFDKIEAGARFGRGLDDRRRPGRNEGRKVRRQNEGKSVQRRNLILVGALDFAFARPVHMGVARMIVMMRVQMRVDEWSVIVMIAVSMDVLKRRQNEGGHECQTAMQSQSSSHQPPPYQEAHNRA